ncbi:MAG: (2Fe-2S)-binding protein [Spirochaetota bacterium]
MDGAGKMLNIKVKVNGIEYRADVPANMTLLQFLRERLHLTGTKEGCGIGECGACTVIMDGKAVVSCLILAAEADGSSIRTIEGEAANGRLTPLQEAFINMGAIQCGFCTPGLIMTARGLLERNPTPSREEIVEAIAGNLCRCTGYEPVIRAIEAACGKKLK